MSNPTSLSNFEYIDPDEIQFLDVDPFNEYGFEAKPMQSLDIPDFDDNEDVDVLSAVDTL